MKKDTDIISVAGMDFTREAAVKILKGLVSDVNSSIFLGTYTTVCKTSSLTWRLENDEERMFEIADMIEDLKDEEDTDDKDDFLLAYLLKLRNDGVTDVVLARGW